MMPSQNTLRQWMDFYSANNLGGPSYRDGVPVSDPNRENRRMDWAMRMSEGDADREFLTSLFSSGSGGGGYMMPRFGGQSENPYMRRAMQLNEDPYSGAGGQKQIMNNLQQFLAPMKQETPAMQRRVQTNPIKNPWSY